MTARRAARDLVITLAYARHAFEAGDFDAARAGALSVLARDPENAPARLLLERVDAAPAHDAGASRARTTVAPERETQTFAEHDAKADVAAENGEARTSPLEATDSRQPIASSSSVSSQERQPRRAQAAGGAAWIAFEQRVRARRADRCAERASRALAQGDAGAAASAIDELESLTPGDSRLAALRVRLASTSTEVAATAPATRSESATDPGERAAADVPAPAATPETDSDPLNPEPIAAVTESAAVAAVVAPTAVDEIPRSVELSDVSGELPHVSAELADGSAETVPATAERAAASVDVAGNDIALTPESVDLAPVSVAPAVMNAELASVDLDAQSAPPDLPLAAAFSSANAVLAQAGVAPAPLDIEPANRDRDPVSARADIPLAAAEVGPDLLGEFEAALTPAVRPRSGRRGFLAACTAIAALAAVTIAVTLKVPDALDRLQHTVSPASADDAASQPLAAPSAAEVTAPLPAQPLAGARERAEGPPSAPPPQPLSSEATVSDGADRVEDVAGPESNAEQQPTGSTPTVTSGSLASEASASPAGSLPRPSDQPPVFRTRDVAAAASQPTPPPVETQPLEPPALVASAPPPSGPPGAASHPSVAPVEQPADATPASATAMDAAAAPTPAVRRVQEAPPPDEAAGVRAAIEAYRQAYNMLDAAAAQRVWPTVNSDALARAFSQLRSQAVTFDRCEMRLGGEMATVLCAGESEWIAAVGDRSPRRERRTWRFDLSRADRSWSIVRVNVER